MFVDCGIGMQSPLAGPSMGKAVAKRSAGHRVFAAPLAGRHRRARGIPIRCALAEEAHATGASENKDEQP